MHFGRNHFHTLGVDALPCPVSCASFVTIPAKSAHIGAATQWYQRFRMARLAVSPK
jgi:hypothetical protein